MSKSGVCTAHPIAQWWRTVGFGPGALMIIALLAVSVPGNTQSVRGRTDTVKSATATTLAGIVRDSDGRPIDQALVYLTIPQRQTRTSPDGSFRLTDLTPGAYTIGVRAVGYLGIAQRILIDTGTTSVIFELTSTAVALTSVVTTASRGGLSGVVIDLNGTPIAEANVRVLGTHGTRTDALGEFFVPVKAGHYLVRVDRTGYKRQLASVTVPPNEGRRMVSTLLPQLKKPNPQEGANLFDMHQRMLSANPVWSRFVTREDLDKLGLTTAQLVAQHYAAQRVNPEECAFLDGGPAKAPLWTIDVQEIEFMETTAAPPPRIRAKDQGPPACRHYIWLRK